MNIRPAQPGDLPALLEIFAHARAFMAQTGNPTQWPATYPGAELMQQQIARGVCYVLEGNARPEATFCYIPGPEPTYAEIYDGGWPDDAPYATIHRMASAGRVHGAAAICFAWCAARGLPLRAGQQGSYRLFDCRTMALAPGTVPLPQTPIILLEGSYSCHPDLWNYCALHAFVDVEPAEQLRRLAARAPEKLEDFKTRWIPKEETYFAHFQIPERCEVRV